MEEFMTTPGEPTVQRWTRRAALLALGCFGVTAVAGCKILPIADQSEGGPPDFDASGYAQKLWASKAMPYFLQSAKPIAEVLDALNADFDAAGQKYGYRPATEGSPWTFVVSGTGTVAAKNTASRAGTIDVALEGTATTVTLQIGPVVKGNAVRDALPFVQFKDFTNQIQFADVGKALTTLAIAEIANAASTITPGQRVTFVGAMSLSSPTEKRLVTPIALKAA